ncbi:MAG: transcriptional regulator [Kangiella sp.]|nr:MAG: transcriptional regulator [Kangiella sp.]
MNPLRFFKCLSDDTRLRMILLIVSEGELCVGELTTALSEIQPKISRHLSQLKKCGLLTDRRQGQWVFYGLNSELPDWCKQVIQQTCDENQDFLKENYKQLCELTNRPVRPGTCC